MGVVGILRIRVLARRVSILSNPIECGLALSNLGGTFQPRNRTAEVLTFVDVGDRHAQYGHRHVIVQPCTRGVACWKRHVHEEEQPLCLLKEPSGRHKNLARRTVGLLLEGPIARLETLSLIHISEPTRLGMISYA